MDFTKPSFMALDSQIYSRNSTNNLLGLLDDEACSPKLAIVNSGVWVSGTTVGKTQSSGINSSCSSLNPNPNDGWVGFTAISPTATVTVQCSSPLDVVADLLINQILGGCLNLIRVAGGCIDANSVGGQEVKTFTNLVVGNFYLIRLYSYRSGSQYQGSYAVQITSPITCNPPTTPSNLTATPTPTSITFTWSSVLGATDYEIYNCVTGNTAITNNTSWTYSGLSAGDVKNIKVRAINTCGNSVYTACVSATTTAATTYTITGHISDVMVNSLGNGVNTPLSSTALSNCIVKIYGNGNGTLLQTLTPNSIGNFTFNTPNIGFYNVKVNYNNTLYNNMYGVYTGSTITILIPKTAYNGVVGFENTMDNKQVPYTINNVNYTQDIKKYNFDALDNWLLNNIRTIDGNQNDVIPQLVKTYNTLKLTNLLLDEAIKLSKANNDCYIGGIHNIVDLVMEALELSISKGMRIPKKQRDILKASLDQLIVLAKKASSAKLEESKKNVINGLLDRLSNLCDILIEGKASSSVATVIKDNITKPIMQANNNDFLNKGLGFIPTTQPNFTNITPKISNSTSPNSTIGYADARAIYNQRVAANQSIITTVADIGQSAEQREFDASRITYIGSISQFLSSNKLVKKYLGYVSKAAKAMSTIGYIGATFKIVPYKVRTENAVFITTSKVYANHRLVQTHNNIATVNPLIGYIDSDLSTYQRLLNNFSTLARAHDSLNATIKLDSIILINASFLQHIKEINNQQGANLWNVALPTLSEDSTQTVISEKQTTFIGLHSMMPAMNLLAGIADIDYTAQDSQYALDSLDLWKTAFPFIHAQAVDALMFNDSIITNYSTPDLMITSTNVITPLEMASNSAGTIQITPKAYGGLNALNVYVVVKPINGMLTFVNDSIPIGGIPSNSSISVNIPFTTANQSDTLAFFDILYYENGNLLGSNGGAIYLRNATTLPVKWSSFTARAISNTPPKAQLNWVTVTEQNVKEFIVERSDDGTVFTRIGTVGASGNSSTPQSYRFIDDEPKIGIGYYRIKSEDLDGKTGFTEVRSVRFTNKGSLSLYPNPSSQGTVHLNYTTDKNAVIKKITLFTNDGKEVFNAIIDAPTYNLDTSIYSSGVYHLSIFLQNEDTPIIEKIIITK